MSRLFLAAEAKHPDSLEKLDSFVCGFNDKRIAYIPTASNGEIYGAWKAGGSIRAAQSLNAKSLEIVELEDQTYKDVITPIRSADILWMAGGMSGYLLYWIRRVELDKALPEILDKGIVYVGSSAGSMICSHTQQVGEWFLGEPEPGASLIPGLGLIDFEIYPHYEEELLPEIKKKWKKGQLYLLKNGEVITVVDGKFKVLGEERILSQ
jgi:dipeptidase E